MLLPRCYPPICKMRSMLFRAEHHDRCWAAHGAVRWAAFVLAAAVGVTSGAVVAERHRSTLQEQIEAELEAFTDDLALDGGLAVTAQEEVDNALAQLDAALVESPGDPAGWALLLWYLVLVPLSRHTTTRSLSEQFDRKPDINSRQALREPPTTASTTLRNRRASHQSRVCTLERRAASHPGHP